MKKVLLSEITSFLARGAAPKYTEKDDFYVLNQKCIRDWRVSLKDARFTDIEAKKVHDDRILRDNDILVNSTGQGTLGRVAQFLKLDRPATVDSHITILRPTPDLVFPEYLGYVLKGRQNEIELLAEGSTGQTELSKLKLANLSIDLPPLDQQKKIANILGSLDEKIELNRRMNETLEQLGQTLFHHHFVDNHESKNWKKRPLGEFFPVKTGKKDANFSTKDGKFPFFTCAQTISCAPSYSFDGSAILVAGNGDFNIKYYTGKFEAYQRTYVLIPHNEELLGFLYFLMKKDLSLITGGSHGSVIKFITKGMIENYRVELPDDNDLANFAPIFSELLDSILHSNKQTQALITLRDSLLPKLISGEIEV